MILHLTATPEGILLIAQCLSIVKDLQQKGVSPATFFETNKLDETEFQTVQSQVQMIIKANNLTHEQH